MTATDVRRSQRPVWAALTVLLITGMITSLFLASRAKQSGEAAAAAEAQVQVQNELAPLLTPSDVSQPVSGEPYQTLRALATRRLLSAGPSDGVTIYRPDGTIVFDLERERVGDRVSGERERLTRVMQDGRESQIIGEDFHVWVQLRLVPGAAPEAVVELTQPYVPLWEAASKPWRLGALGFAALLLPAIAMLLMSFRGSLPKLRSQPREKEGKPEQGWADEVPGTQPAAAATMATLAQEGPVAKRVPSPDAPAYEHPGYRAEVEARMQAEERAAKAEEVAAQMKRQLADAKAGKLTATDEELLRMREQFDDAMGRVRQAEDDRAELAEQLRGVEIQRAELAERVDRGGTAATGAAAAGTVDAEVEALARAAEDRASAAEDRAAEADLSAAEARQTLEAVEQQALQAAMSIQAAEERAVEAEANARAADLRAQQAEESARRLEEHALAAQQSANSGEDRLFAIEQRAEAAEVRARDAEQQAAELGERLKAYKDESARIGEQLAGSKDDSIRVSEQRAAAREDARLAKEQLAAAQAQSLRTAEELAAAMEDARRSAEQAAESSEKLAATREQLTAAEEQARLAGERAESGRGELMTLGERLTAAEEEVAMVRVQLASAQERERDSKERLETFEERALQAEEHLRRVAEERRAEAEAAEREAEEAPRLEEVLRITQERLARSAERLQETEQRARDVEHELESNRVRLEELEGEQRREKLQEALHHLRGDEAQGAVAAPIEERRASAPFLKALSMDAKNSVASIHGLILAMKHVENKSDTPQMLRKLAAHARKLDHLVGDLLDADKLARGDIQLTYRRTDIDALVRRVVEEAAIDGDRTVKVLSEPVIVAVDPIRVEGIVVGLLNNAVDRSRPRREIIVRVAAEDGGALISVEDDEPSSDGSMSPVVARFADVHGGWAIVESRPGGGSAFRVFLPDHEADATRTTISPETNTIEIRDGEHMPAEAPKA